jgi:hypothetical protein
MADTLVYLYAVGDAVLGETVSPGRTRIGGAAVRVIVDGPGRWCTVVAVRDLSGVDYVYLGADGIHVNIPLEEHKLCLLVMIGVRSAGREGLGPTTEWSTAATAVGITTVRPPRRPWAGRAG